MALPHNALVLVADGRKTLFFRNHGDENQIDLRMESHEPAAMSARMAPSRRTRRGWSNKAPGSADRPTKSPTSINKKRIAGSRMQRRN